MRQVFLDFIDCLTNSLRNGLPGKAAHLRMVPHSRYEEFETLPAEGIPSGVILLLYPYRASVYTVLIRRPVYAGAHSGQIGLPGGKFEDGDGHIRNTAIREAAEEIALNPDTLTIIGQLSSFVIPPSRFHLTPFVGYLTNRPVFNPDPEEVAEILEVDIREIADHNLKEKDIAVHGGTIYRTPYYDLNGHVVWGATGMLLAEFSELAKTCLAKLVIPSESHT
jgi:8-oxo-dGTP pyrophosphatase MutT (NUDIX family)